MATNSFRTRIASTNTSFATNDNYVVKQQASCVGINYSADFTQRCDVCAPPVGKRRTKGTC